VSQHLPVTDVSTLLTGSETARQAVAEEIGAACRDLGFFYAAGHAIGHETLAQLASASHRFFALPEAENMQIAMEHGGRAWRGFFPVGGELTSVKPDIKEGPYFSEELGPHDPRVRAGLTLHGANLFPDAVPEPRAAVSTFMHGAERSGHAIMEGMALSLGLDAHYFRRTYTSQPTLLFRIFHYPGSTQSEGWGWASTPTMAC
jgi:isopenicillin N synthase-like dioxygenase